ncbi:MAG: hypothetical protein RIQ89_1580 [Bacteroidota bacterium]|jgi:hypothetical protein
MRTALLRYPTTEVLPPLERICLKKGFKVKLIDTTSGKVIARKGFPFLSPRIDVELEVQKVDEFVTKVLVHVNNNGVEDVVMEEAFVGTIYKHF